MEEARRVLERLERIEKLRGSEAEAGQLVGELRALLVEGEAWLAAEKAGVDPTEPDNVNGEISTRRAAQSLEALEARLDRRARLARQRAGSGPGLGLPSTAEADEVIAETLDV